MFVCDREGERDKSNKIKARLRMLSDFPQCSPATCQLNHLDSVDTSKSSLCNKNPLPLSSVQSPSTVIQRVHKICKVPQHKPLGPHCHCVSKHICTA